MKLTLRFETEWTRADAFLVAVGVVLLLLVSFVIRAVF